MQKEENFSCRNCGAKIEGHHFYLHDRMCEDCFNKTYFPEADYEKAKKEIEKEN
jgi:NMD protein affecting ribosome stability and mRNA decay